MHLHFDHFHCVYGLRFEELVHPLFLVANEYLRA